MAVVVKTERPKFVFPQATGADYEKLRKRLFEYSQSYFVDDYVEIKNIIKELESIDPVKIETEMIPRL